MGPNGLNGNGGSKKGNTVTITGWKMNTEPGTGCSGQDIMIQVNRMSGSFMVFLLESPSAFLSAMSYWPQVQFHIVPLKADMKTRLVEYA